MGSEGSDRSARSKREANRKTERIRCDRSATEQRDHCGVIQRHEIDRWTTNELESDPAPRCSTANEADPLRDLAQLARRSSDICTMNTIQRSRGKGLGMNGNTRLMADWRCSGTTEATAG